MHPVGDQLKIEVSSDDYGLGGESGRDSGIVVEVPDVIHYFGKHNMAFENSFMATNDLKKILDYFKGFIGKRVWWETFQDKGRRFTEGKKEYVYLKMSDILTYSDDVDYQANIVDDTRSGGFKI